jgi:hypothetical protein
MRARDSVTGLLPQKLKKGTIHMSRNDVVALFLLAFLSAPASAAAQNISDVSKALDNVQTLEHRFALARSNLQDMSRALDGGQFSATHEMAVGSGQFYGLFEAAGWLGIALTSARCPADLELHQLLFGEAATDLVAEGDRLLHEMNQLLTVVHNPAALDAATRMRDIVAEIRDTYKPFSQPVGK